MSKHSTRSAWRSATRKALAVVVALALTVGALPLPLAQPAPALAAGNCATSSPPSGAYTIELCFTSPTDGETVTGDRTVTVSRNIIVNSGPTPLFNALVYSLDDPNDPNDVPYLLTAFATPFSFVLPSARFFKDGAYNLSVVAEMRDLNNLQGPTITVNLANGIVTPPGSGNSFAEVNGPASGPVVLAAVGDGPDGSSNAMKVTNLIDAWNPDMFLYLGDVYDKARPTEYYNWYRPGSALGRFRAITNPTIGNHEYEADGAPGYFDYWGANTPHYYSVDAGGWHIISLDSTSQFNQTAPGSAQYNWLANDLSTNTAACTIAFFHHPVFNVGPEADGQVFKSTLANIWSLLDQYDVDIALTGHDHDYQRWQPLNGAGTVDPDGITEFVVGTGGHGIQQFELSDQRLATGVDSNNSFGALRLVLNQDGAAYRFVTVDGAVRDSGSVACDATAPDTTPPTEPINLTASPVSGTQRVDLDWNAANDNVGVTGYDVYRDGVNAATTGPVTNYSDTGVVAGVTHTYQVRARDAAGNVSDASNTAIVNASSQFFLFSDDFEGGTLSRWTSGNLAVQQQVVESGVWAAEAKSANTTLNAQARKTLSSTQSDLYTRTKFKVVALNPTGDVTLLQLRTNATNAPSILRVYVTAAGKLAHRNDGGTANVSVKTSTTTVGPGWHEIQVRARVDTANPGQGQVEVWYDGSLVPDLTLTRNLGAVQIGRLQLGEALTGKTYDIVFDDVAADTQPIPYGWSASPDTTPPSAPVLTLGESGPNEHAVGTTLYYNPAFGNSGAFTVGAATADPDSGIARVEFPEVFGADADIDTTSPYGGTYTWGDTSTATGSMTVTATNGFGLSSSSTFTVTPDSNGPAAFALSAPAADATIQNGQAVSAAPTDALSGIAQVEFRSCPGNSCTWNAGTAIGAADSSDPYAVTWSNQPADGQYTLLARATDNVGNTTDSAAITVTVSNATPTPTPTPPPPTTLTIAPAADADVNEGSPNTNYGTNTLLRLDGGTDPDREGYLRFNVSGISGTVQSAKLRLYSPNGTDNGPAVHPVSDTTWAETGIKWNNKPAHGATALADVAKVTTNTWVEYDLGPAAVTADGLYSFALLAQSTDGVDFNSRDNATNQPQLVLTVDESTPPAAASFKASKALLASTESEPTVTSTAIATPTEILAATPIATPEQPAIPEGTLTPSPTVTPEGTPTTDLTATPDATPATTATSSPTTTATATAEGTATPDVTLTPGPTATPDLTATPDATPATTVTPSPPGAVTPVEATPSAPPEETPTPEGTPTPAPDAASSDAGVDAARPLNDAPAGSDGGVGRDDPERLDTPEPTAVPEASGEPARPAAAPGPDGETQPQQLATQGDDEPAQSNGGGQPPSTAPADPGESDRGDGEVEAGPVRDDRAEAPAGKPEHGPGEATVAAGDPARDGTAQSDDGDPAEQGNDARLAPEPGGNPQPDARPSQETASTSPDDDGQAENGGTHGRKAMRRDDPTRGGHAETQTETRGTESSSATEPEQDATPPQDTRAETSDRPADDAMLTGETEANPAAGVEPVTRGEHGKPRGGTKSRPGKHGKHGKAAKGGDSATAYRIVTTRQSPHSGDAAVVVDDDATTAWRTEPGATPHEAWVVLDLGKPRSIGRVRWLGAPDGLAGTLHVAASTDGKRWKRAAGVAQEATDGWQELRLKHAVEARYVRFTFTKPSGAPRLGGLAEVEIWPAAKGDATGGAPPPDRHGGTAGHAPAKPGHERATSGKPPHGAKAHPGRKQQPKNDKDQQDSTQDPNPEQAKSPQKHKPDQTQGKDRNTGPEQKKKETKSSHKRAQRGRGETMESTSNETETAEVGTSECTLCSSPP